MKHLHVDMMFVQVGSIEQYDMRRVNEDLGLSTDSLISLALFLGCDYLPKGVPGVGPKQVHELLQELRGLNILTRCPATMSLQLRN